MSQLPQAATSDAQQPAVSESGLLPGVMPAASCVQERVSPEPTIASSEGMPQAAVHPAKHEDAPNSKAGLGTSSEPKRLPGSEGNLGARLAELSSSGSGRARQRPDAGKTLLRAGGSLPADQGPRRADEAAEGSQGPRLSAEQEPPQPPAATAEAGRESSLSAERGSPQPPGSPAGHSRGSSLPADEHSPQPAGQLPLSSRRLSLPLGQGSAQPAEFCAQADQGRKPRLQQLPGGVKQTVPSNTPDMLRPLNPAQVAAGAGLQAGSASQAPAQAAEASQQASAPGREPSSSPVALRQGLKHAAGYCRKSCAAESLHHALEGGFSIPAAWGGAGRQQSLRGLRERVAPEHQEHTAAIMSHSALGSTLAQRGSQLAPQGSLKSQAGAEQLAAHADPQRRHGQAWLGPLDSLRPQQGPTVEQPAAGADRPRGPSGGLPAGQVPRQQVSLPPPPHAAFNLRGPASTMEQGPGQASPASPHTWLLPSCSPALPPPLPLPPSPPRVPALPHPAASAGPFGASAAQVRQREPSEAEWQSLADSGSSRLIVQWQLPKNEIIPRTPFTAAVQTLQWHQQGEGGLQLMHSCRRCPCMQHAGPDLVQV